MLAKFGRCSYLEVAENLVSGDMVEAGIVLAAGFQKGEGAYEVRVDEGRGSRKELSLWDSAAK